jgi:hypothetical protein
MNGRGERLKPSMYFSHGLTRIDTDKKSGAAAVLGRWAGALFG